MGATKVVSAIVKGNGNASLQLKPRCLNLGALRYSSTFQTPSSKPSSFSGLRSHKYLFTPAVHHRITPRRSSSDVGLNHTALHKLHVENGGKMVPFGGFSMPVQYSDLSVGESHKWTREKASVFDVGHMYVLLRIV